MDDDVLDADQHVDADDAPAREIKRLSSQVEALKRSFSEKLNRDNEQTVQRERERIVSELELERRRITTSPEPAYERARKLQDVIDRESALANRFREEDVRRQRTQPVQQSVPSEVVDWGKRNPWFFALKQANSPIALEAEAIHMSLNAQGMPLKENLEETTRRMAEQYPHLVEGAAPRKKQTRRQPSWVDLPAEIRKTAEKDLIRRGVFGQDEYEARERYAKAYWKEYGND
jgi:hypothetical protein